MERRGGVGDGGLSPRHSACKARALALPQWPWSSEAVPSGQTISPSQPGFVSTPTCRGFLISEAKVFHVTHRLKTFSD